MDNKISNKLFFHRMLNGIADATIKTFIPIIIYNQTKNLTMCFLYCFISFAVTALLFYLLKTFMKKHSALAILIHIIPLIIEFFILLNKINYLSMIIIAILDAFAVCLYYGPVNNIFVGLENNNNVAKFETGALVGKILFTLISSYLLAKVKDSIIFIVVMATILYLLSLIPIILSYNNLKQLKTNSSNISFIQTHNKYFKFNIFNFFIGTFSFFVEIVLPLYLYIMGLSIDVVGIIISLTYIIQIIANYLASYLSKKNIKTIPLVISSIILIFCIILILIIKNPYIIYIITIIINFCYKIICNIIFEIYSIKIKKDNTYINALVSRDIYQNVARTINSAVFFIFPNFITLFIFGIISGISLGTSCYVSRDTLYEKNK